MSTKRFTVYSFPTSSCSQRVRLSLYLKDVDFDIVHIDLPTGGQSDPAYMAINPAGTVPTLRDGDKLITDSDDIIDYLDKEVSRDPVLVPDPASDLGKEVATWRQMLFDVKMYVITFGTALNPSLSVTGVKLMPQQTYEGLEKSRLKNIDKLESLATENPQLSQAYLNKRDRIRKQMEDKVQLSLENVKRELDKIEGIFDKAEQQLKRSAEEHKSPDVFMFGKSMNIVDIYMAILLERLTVLGNISRYIGMGKRRNLYEYYCRMSMVPAVAKTGILTLPQSVREELEK